MERQRLLLLLPRSAYRAGPFIAAATRLGVELVVGTDHATTLPGSRTLELPFANPDRCIKQIGQFADSQPLDAVFGCNFSVSLRIFLRICFMNFFTSSQRCYPPFLSPLHTPPVTSHFRNKAQTVFIFTGSNGSHAARVTNNSHTSSCIHKCKLAPRA